MAADPAMCCGRAARNRRCAAFTLVELLVVIAILAMLMALAMPTLSGARERARRIWGASNVLYGEDYGHGTYHGTLYLDGSARGHADNFGYMRAMNTQSTNAPGNPVQETIWREFFEQ